MRNKEHQLQLRFVWVKEVKGFCYRNDMDLRGSWSCRKGGSVATTVIWGSVVLHASSLQKQTFCSPLLSVSHFGCCCCWKILKLIFFDERERERKEPKCCCCCCVFNQSEIILSSLIVSSSTHNLSFLFNQNEIISECIDNLLEAYTTEIKKEIERALLISRQQWWAKAPKTISSINTG